MYTYFNYHEFLYRLLYRGSVETFIPESISIDLKVCLIPPTKDQNKVVTQQHNGEAAREKLKESE